MDRNPEVAASARDEALFDCTKPSGVPRDPSQSTVSLNSQRHAEKLPEVTGKSRENSGFLLRPEKNLENPSLTRLEARFPYHDSRAMTCSPSPRAWRPDFPGTTREAP